VRVHAPGRRWLAGHRPDQDGRGEADAVETVVCDNGVEQAIGGGSIMVHTK
jgi:hypothetical protein